MSRALLVRALEVVSSAIADRNSKKLTGVRTGAVLTRQACSWESAKKASV